MREGRKGGRGDGVGVGVWGWERSVVGAAKKKKAARLGVAARPARAGQRALCRDMYYTACRRISAG